MKNIAVYCAVLLITVQSFAHNQENSIVITLVNNSQKTLELDRVALKNPEHNMINVGNVILPGEQASIYGSTTAQADLEGVIYFKDDLKFHIRDYRQFHYGQYVFAMSGPNITSRIISTTRNSIIKPRLLSIVAATVELLDK